MRVVGQNPDAYRCKTCPAHVRALRRCPKTSGLEVEDLRQLKEARRRDESPPADPTHEAACAILKIEADRRASAVLADHAQWRDHGLGPMGSSRALHPAWWVQGQEVILATVGEMEREEEARRDADRRARDSGVRLYNVGR